MDSSPRSSGAPSTVSWRGSTGLTWHRGRCRGGNSLRIFKQVVSLSSTRCWGEQKMKPITVDGGKGTVELDAEGVLHLVWKPETVLEAVDVYAAMATVNELADGA